MIHFEETQEEPRDYRLFESVSEIFATALINARKREEEGYRLALLYEERSTIARELHDSIAQSLAFSKNSAYTPFFLGLKEELPKEQLRGNRKTNLEPVSLPLHTQLREVLTAFRLKPTSADIRQSIHKLLEEFRERSGIEYNLKNDLLDFEINANKQVHFQSISLKKH